MNQGPLGVDKHHRLDLIENTGSISAGTGDSETLSRESQLPIKVVNKFVFKEGEEEEPFLKGCGKNDNNV